MTDNRDAHGPDGPEGGREAERETVISGRSVRGREYGDEDLQPGYDGGPRFASGQAQENGATLVGDERFGSFSHARVAG